METLRLFIALFLPWLLGAVWLGWRWQPMSPGAWPLLLGYGYILGILVTTLVMRLVDMTDLPLDFTLIAGILATLIGLGAWMARGRLGNDGRSIFSPTWQRLPSWQKWLFGLLLTLILIRLGGIAVEILLRPLYPWDAWTTWAVRSRVWFEYQNLVPFVSPTQWLTNPEETSYTIAAWHYPETVSLISLWMALGLGSWNESVNNLPWLLCAITLGLGGYGQARLWGIGPLPSLIFIYLLLSIPILNTHIALAGYADLWMATTFGLAAIAFFQWLRTHDRGQGIMALVLGLACPFIKAEGAVWLLTFIPALMIARISTKNLLWIFGSLSLLLLIWFFAGGFSTNLLWLGEIHLTPELVQFPYLGRFELSFNVNWNPFIQNLFILDTWHLFWYLVILIILFSIPKIATDKLSFAYFLLILAGLVMLFFLFTMTEARLWAEKFTSINRLFLHITPALLFYVLIMVKSMSEGGLYTGRISARPPA